MGSAFALLLLLCLPPAAGYGKTRPITSSEAKSLTAVAGRRYQSRPLIRAEDVRPLGGHPLAHSGRQASCQAKTPCGLFIESSDATGPAVCKDLCMDAEFLPASLPPAGGDREAGLQPQLQQLQALIRHTQSPPGCQPHRLHAMASPKAGLGVTLHYAAHSLLVAVSTGAVYIPAPGSLETWTSQELCGGHRRSLMCFFHAISPCKPSKILEKGAGILHLLPGEFEAQALGIGKGGIRDDTAPKEFASLGSMMALSQALSVLWQPRAWLAEAVRDARANLRLIRPVVALHVRRGDACASGRECWPWERYREALKTMKSLYGARSVVLATDDAEVVGQCHEDGILPCSATPYDRTPLLPPARAAGEKKARGYIENRIRAENLDGGKLAAAALVDIALLAECDVFVGAFSSSMSRIAYLLMMARQQGPVPYISLDSPLGRPDGGII